MALPDTGTVTLTQRTRYPWEGDVEIAVETDARAPFSLFFRIPGWCQGARAAVNDETVGTGLQPGSYLEVRRQWRAGDLVRLSLPMPVRQMECHPYVANNNGRVALARGPLVYCLEGADHPGLDLRDIVLTAAAELNAAFVPDLLGGVVAVRAQAVASPPAGWEHRLYRPAPPTDNRQPRADRRPQTAALQTVPYYAWANREPGPMQVWISTRSLKRE